MFEEECRRFSSKNRFSGDVEHLFGEVFVNSSLILEDGTEIFGILDYTHNVNR